MYAGWLCLEKCYSRCVFRHTQRGNENRNSKENSDLSFSSVIKTRLQIGNILIGWAKEEETFKDFKGNTHSIS